MQFFSSQGGGDVQQQDRERPVKCPDGRFSKADILAKGISNVIIDDSRHHNQSTIRNTLINTLNWEINL